MKGKTIIICDGAADPNKFKGNAVKKFAIHSGEGIPVVIKLVDMCHRLLHNPSLLFYDLCDIAAYVYVADQYVSRGGKTLRRNGEERYRDFHFFVPVRDPDLWNSPKIKELLINGLHHLTDDFFEFDFSSSNHLPKDPKYFQMNLDYDLISHLDEILLFSGGLDSLAGALNELVNNKKNVMLVSHYAGQKVQSAQTKLVAELKEGFPGERICHAQIKANNKKVDYDSKDLKSQYSRSFLFTALAATFANMLGKDRILFYENGVTSFNLHYNDSQKSTHSSRTTHPKVFEFFSALISELSGKSFSIDNPFIWNTKKDVINTIGKAKYSKLIPVSRSCSTTYSLKKGKPHCGTCAQCIDRRVGIMASDYSNDEEYEKYDKDMFLDALETDLQKTSVLSYAELYKSLSSVAPLQFTADYSNVYTPVKNVHYITNGEDNIFNLFNRQASIFMSIVTDQYQKNMKRILTHQINPDCLLVSFFQNIYPSSDPESKDIFNGSKIDLIEECIRKFVHADFETLIDAFRWAANTLVLKDGAALEASGLEKYLTILKSKGVFTKEHPGDYYRHKRGKSWKIE